MDKKHSSSNPVSAPEQHPPASPPLTIDMVFRFWAPAARDSDSTQGAHTSAQNPGVLALIEDAVAARRAVFVAGQNQLYVSGLRRPSDALAVSRQIQLGMQGFRGRHGGPPVALSIAIDASNQAVAAAAPGSEDTSREGEGQPSSPATNATPQPSHDLVTLLKLSKPAQILVTHDLCQRMAPIKGLPLKSFQGRFGIFEYLWTAEEKLDLLQSEPQLTLAALPTAPPTDSGAKEVAAPASETAAALARKDASGALGKVFGQKLWWRAALGSHQRIVIAALAFVVISTLVFVGAHFSHRSSEPLAKRSSPALSLAPAAAVQYPPATAAAPPASPTNPFHAAGTSSLALVPSQHDTPQKSRKPAVAPEKRTPAAAEPSVACTLGGDIAHYLSLAQQDRGSGNYTSAVRLFRQILACEPNNAAARDGLARAIQGQEQGRH
jgi:hypothetical protein